MTESSRCNLDNVMKKLATRSEHTQCQNITHCASTADQSSCLPAENLDNETSSLRVSDSVVNRPDPVCKRDHKDGYEDSP